MDYFRPKVTPATEKTRWTSASRGNRWILETYLPTDQENVSLETPEFVVTQPVITSFWNFLKSYEDPELNREKLPIQGLAMLLMGLRKQSSEECWESFISKTSQFIKRIVKRKFQKKKKVWAELLLVVYYLLIKLSPCDGETAFSTDGACESSLTTVMESLATQIVLFMTSYQILMVEELICFWSNYPQLESPTDCGLLAFIDAMVLLTNWLYLGHFPAEPRALSWPNSGHHYWGSTSGNSEIVALKL